MHIWYEWTCREMCNGRQNDKHYEDDTNNTNNNDNSSNINNDNNNTNNNKNNNNTNNNSNSNNTYIILTSYNYSYKNVIS